MPRRRLLLALTAGAALIALLAVGGYLWWAPERSAGDIAAAETSLLAPPAAGAAAPTTPSTSAEQDVTRFLSGEEAAPGPFLEPNDPWVPASKLAPVGLRIDRLGVDAPIIAIGVDQTTGQMAVPANASDVAWYEFGPTPGAPGSAVLAAHVDLDSQGPGVFFDLKTLEPGDRIRVSFEDGSTKDFAVQARTTYHKDELPLEAIFSRDGQPVLTLITCGGGFNWTARSYDSNVVVYALPAAAIDGGELRS